MFDFLENQTEPKFSSGIRNRIEYLIRFGLVTQYDYIFKIFSCEFLNFPKIIKKKIFVNFIKKYPIFSAYLCNFL